MTTWIKLLPLELNGINKLIEPPDDIKKGEHKVGTMSEELKRLYTLWKESYRLAEQHKLNHRLEPSVDEEKTWKYYDYKTDALREIFWFCVHEEFDLWGKPTTAVRKGWQVVWYEEPDILPFFKHLFGGG